MKHFTYLFFICLNPCVIFSILFGSCQIFSIGIIFYWCCRKTQHNEKNEGIAQNNMQLKNNHNKNLQHHDNLNNNIALQQDDHNEDDKRIFFNNNKHEKDKILNLSEKNGFKKVLINLKKNLHK